MSETNNLIDPTTLSADFDISTLANNPKELAKYAFPEGWTPETCTYTYDLRLYGTPNEVNLDKITPEELGSLIINKLKQSEQTDYFGKKVVARSIERIYMDLRVGSIVDDNMKLDAIKQVLAKKKRAIADAERRKQQARNKAIKAAQALKAMGVDVKLPEALTAAPPAKKTKKKK